MSFDEWMRTLDDKPYMDQEGIAEEAWNAALDEAVKVVNTYQGCDGIAEEVGMLKTTPE